MARALVRARVGAAVPSPHQRLGPPRPRRRDPGVRDLAPGRSRPRSSATSSPRSTACPTSSSRSSASSTRSGALWALGLVVVAALVAAAVASRPRPGHRRRRRLGAGAGSSARSSSRTRASRTALDVVTRIGDDSVAFPAVRVAVIVAVISVASPYLTRPVRRLGQLLVLLIAIASLYLGTTLPDGALAGGRPRVGDRRARAPRVRLARWAAHRRPGARRPWSSSGSTPTTCICSPHQPRTGTAMAASDADGELADPGARSRRGRRAADVEVLALARVQGRRARRSTPPGSRTSRRRPTRCSSRNAPACTSRRWSSPAAAGPGMALHRVTHRSAGRVLADARSRRGHRRACSTTCGSRSRRCTTARVAHGRLNATHVIVDGTTVSIADFEFASGAAATGRRAADVAELLVSTALLVGDDRAVAAADAGIGDDAIVEALPYLQPAALEPRPAHRPQATASSGRRRSPACAPPRPPPSAPTSRRSRSSTGSAAPTS